MIIKIKDKKKTIGLDEKADYIIVSKPELIKKFLDSNSMIFTTNEIWKDFSYLKKKVIHSGRTFFIHNVVITPFVTKKNGELGFRFKLPDGKIFKTENIVAKRGLYLNKPHAELIWRRKKNLIVKDKRFDVFEPLFLLDRNLAYGIIQLAPATEIDTKEFKASRHMHMISDEERKNWWGDTEKLWAYSFVFTKFKQPREWKFVKGTETLVGQVEFQKLFKDDDVTKLTDKVLIYDHTLCHSFYNRILEGKKIKGWSKEDVLNHHVKIINEMVKRGFKFEIKDQLDKDSQKLIRGELVKECAPVLPSGKVEGEMIVLDDVLSYFKNFKIQSPFIYLTGGIVSNGKTMGDIDILIPNWLDPDLKRVLEFRIARAFPPDLAKRIHFVYDIFAGPFSSSIPLYELEVKKMESDIIELSKELQKADPYLIIPDEKRTYKYVVQHHYRGKSVHADIRMESTDKEFLIGWTLSDVIAGKIKKPILTLKEAKETDKKRGYFKMNWKTGIPLERKTRAGTIVYANILSQRKATEPKQWLNVEGVVKPGEVGATKEYPGVFTIIDKGTVEYGAQKPQFHEYFMKGKLKGRYVLRQLKLGKELSKEILPPGKEEEFKEELAWIFMKPKDETPYVLSKKAVDDKWIPEQGVSALPKEWRNKVLAELRYWEKRNEKDRLKTREDLIVYFKEKKISKLLETKKALEFFKPVIKPTELKLAKFSFTNDDNLNNDWAKSYFDKGIAVESLPQGLYIYAQRNGDEFLIEAEGLGRIKTESLIEDLKKIDSSQFIIAGWLTGQDDSGYLNKGEIINSVKEGIPFKPRYLFDECLYLDGMDLTKQFWFKRYEALKKLLSQNFAKAESLEAVIVNDTGNLLETVKMVTEKEFATGAIMKVYDSTYPIDVPEVHWAIYKEKK